MEKVYIVSEADMHYLMKVQQAYLSSLKAEYEATFTKLGVLDAEINRIHTIQFREVDPENEATRSS